MNRSSLNTRKYAEESFLKKFFRKHHHEAGFSGIGLVLLFGGVAVAAMSFLLSSGQNRLKQTISDVTVSATASQLDQLSSLAGYFISNNFIACRQDPWEGSTKKNQCRWIGQTIDEKYTPSFFGLGKISRSKNGSLVLPLDDKGILYGVSDSGRIHKMKINSASLSFSLEGFSEEAIEDAQTEIGADNTDTLDIRSLLSVKSDDMKKIDDDEFFVFVTAKMTYTKVNRKRTVYSNVAFKRPIAVIRVTVNSSTTCTAKCNTSMSQHTSPACRGTPLPANNSEVSLNGETINQGPGNLYAATFRKKVCIKERPGADMKDCKNEDLSGRDRIVKVNIPSFVPPDSSVTWEDRVKCKQFTIQTSGPTQAQRQHTFDAGKVSYTLSPEDSLTNLEPFRMNTDVAEITKGTINGQVEYIYVDPPH